MDGAMLGRMNSRILHRGPDDEGVYLAPGVGLAMRRLAILDIAGGHQPMHTADGRFTMVFNGEIMNFLELRGQLEARGQGVEKSIRTRSENACSNLA